MAWQTPEIGHHHAARDAGVSALTASPVAATGFGLYRLIDDLPHRPFKFTSSGANSTVTLDQGAGSFPDLDGLFIPAGHNLGGSDIEWRHSTDNFSASDDLVASVTVPAGTAAIWLTAGTASSRRYQQLKVVTSGQWQFAELWWTERNAFTVQGPDPDFTLGKVPNETVVVFDSGYEGVKINGDERLSCRLRFNAQDGSNLTIHRAILAEVGSGRLHPVVYVPPDDYFSPVIAWAIPETPRQDFKAPTLGPSYRIEYLILERAT